MTPLLEQAEPLFALHDQWMQGQHHDTLENFRRLVQAALQPFMQSDALRSAGYVLCALFDESVLTQSTQQASFWQQHPLLQVYFQEAWGGEQVFVLIDNAIPHPQQQYEFLCLGYICLCLGFQGKYAQQEGGMAQLMQLKQRLYQLIEHFTPSHAPPAVASPSPALPAKQRRYVWAPKRVLWLTGATVLIAALGMQTLLYQRGQEVSQQLSPLVSHVA